MEETALFMVGKEWDALLTALKMCRGEYYWAYEGWEEESHLK